MENHIDEEVITELHDDDNLFRPGEMRPTLIRVIHDDKEEGYYLVHGQVLKSLIDGLAQLDRKMIPITNMRLMYGYAEAKIPGNRWMHPKDNGDINKYNIVYTDEVDGPMLCLSKVFLVNAGEVCYRQSNTFDKIYILQHVDLTYTETEAKEALYEVIKEKVKNHRVV